MNGLGKEFLTAAALGFQKHIGIMDSYPLCQHQRVPDLLRAADDIVKGIVGTIGLIHAGLQHLFFLLQLIHLVLDKTGILKGRHHRNRANDPVLFNNRINICKIFFPMFHTQ